MPSVACQKCSLMFDVSWVPPNGFTCLQCDPDADYQPGPYEAARRCFDGYAGIDGTRVRVDEQSLLWEMQARHAAWEALNFGYQPMSRAALGVAEEFGELLESVLALGVATGRLSQAALKGEQGIRGNKDPEVLRRKIADGLADIVVFALSVATKARVDLGTLVCETLRQDVFTRDWKAFPKNGRTE